jgi:hypothetical protein
MLTMSADHFPGLVDGDGKFQEIVHSYPLALMVQISQSVSCNGRHELNQPLANGSCKAMTAPDRTNSC